MPTTLEDLRAKLKEWKGCDLAKTSNPVLGEGNDHATVMFIGEAPGEQEDKLGRPFVGPAGKFLDELLGTIGFKREDVDISNVVKYRPPQNRDPTDEEKAQCMPWLKLEIALIKPRVIVPLGRHALGHFFSKLSISNVHGKAQTLPQASSSGQASADRQGGTSPMIIFPIYHPAAALHNGSLRQALYDDFAALGNFLKSL